MTVGQGARHPIGAIVESAWEFLRSEATARDVVVHRLQSALADLRGLEVLELDASARTGLPAPSAIDLTPILAELGDEGWSAAALFAGHRDGYVRIRCTAPVLCRRRHGSKTVGMDKRTDWAAHLAAWRASGKTASVYCAEQGLKLGALRYWSGRMVRREDSGATAAPERVRLAQVRTQPSTRPRVGGVLSLSIGAVTVQVPEGMDVAALRETVAMLLDVVGGPR